MEKTLDTYNMMDSLRESKKYLNAKTISAGLLATIFGCTGPALIIIGGASDGGLTEAQTISWIFAIYFFAGLLGLYMALRYRQPISGGWSIPGAVLIAGALTQFTLAEAMGAYIVAGLIVLILGVTGWIGKVMYWIPAPIVMAMIVGALIRFGTDMILGIEQAPLIAGSAILLYLVSSKITDKIPPIIMAFTVAVILAIVLGEFQMQGIETQFTVPQLMVPGFSLEAIVSIAIPLALLVVGAENAQATGVLMAQKYKPPVNAMTIFSGLGGIITAFFGGHNANVAGPMTAICASKEAGVKEGRYTAVVVNGFTFMAFAIFAGLLVPFVTAMPGVLIGTVAGLAIIGVLLSSLQSAFSQKKFQVGAFFALIIAMSGVEFFGISSPFWAIIGGILVSLIVEGNQFKERAENEVKEAA